MEALPVRELARWSAFAGCAEGATELPNRLFSRYGRMLWNPAEGGGTMRRHGTNRAGGSTAPREGPPCGDGGLSVAALRLHRPSEGPAESPGLLVRDVATLYLRHCAVESVHGAEARAERLRVLGAFVDVQGGTAVADCKPWMLTEFIESHPSWKSVSTRRAKCNAIRAAFEWATRQERIDRNPFRSVSYAEAERRPELPDATLEVVERLANKSFEVALRFLRLTGVRLGELCAANWPDADLERGILTVHRHKSRRYTGKPKIVALVPDAVALLVSLKLQTPALQNCAAFPEGMPGSRVPADTRPIFLNSRGTRWTRYSLGLQLRRIKARYGIQTNASLHGIRHRLATAAVSAGAPLTLVAAQLGHASPAITSRYYVHVGEQQIDAIRDAVSRGLPRQSKKDP